MRRILAESKRYIIQSEYESVFLKFKQSEREILIGDFYGDPEVGFIAADERYCVVGGCGIIVYFIEEPFLDYRYDYQSEQWFDLQRTEENIMWIVGIKPIKTMSAVILEVELKNHEIPQQYRLDIYSKTLNRLKD